MIQRATCTSVYLNKNAMQCLTQIRDMTLYESHRQPAFYNKIYQGLLLAISFPTFEIVGCMNQLTYLTEFTKQFNRNFKMDGCLLHLEKLLAGQKCNEINETDKYHFPCFVQWQLVGQHTTLK